MYRRHADRHRHADRRQQLQLQHPGRRDRHAAGGGTASAWQRAAAARRSSRPWPIRRHDHHQRRRAATGQRHAPPAWPAPPRSPSTPAARCNWATAAPAARSPARVTVNAGGTFDVNRSDAVTFTSKIGGSGTLGQGRRRHADHVRREHLRRQSAGQQRAVGLQRQYRELPRRQFHHQRRRLGLRHAHQDDGRWTRRLTLAGGSISGTGTLTGGSALSTRRPAR